MSISKICNRKTNCLCSLCLLIFISLALSCCALLGAEKGFICMVSLRPALGELAVKRNSPVDAAFHSLRKNTLPQESEVPNQDSV